MIENVLQSFIIHAACHDLLDLNGRGMERESMPNMTFSWPTVL